MSPLSTVIPLRQLEMWIMPVARFHTRKHLSGWEIVAFEALARGPAGSSLFLPGPLFDAARSHGLAALLDQECLRRAVRMVSGRNAGRPLSINLSLETLLCDRFESFITAHLVPECRPHVILEIGQGEIRSYPVVRSRLRWLRERGIRVAIDDLGAEGSSLDRLDRLGAVDFVKVAPEVVMHTWTEWPSLAQAWLKEASLLTRSIGAELIVQGIEASSRALLGELSGLRVALGQGYLFGEPMAAAAAATWHPPVHHRGLG